MNDLQLAREIARGIVETHVEAGYDEVSCSTAGDYPSMGVSQWEGIGGRGDDLLNYIEGGARFAGRTYSDIEASGELDTLCALLGSPQGQEAQNKILAVDCLSKYIPAVREALTAARCIIYAGIWCPTSHDEVRGFIRRRAERGYDVNDLGTLRDLFRDQYAVAVQCEEYAEGYANRAERTYEYVAALELGTA